MKLKSDNSSKEDNSVEYGNELIFMQRKSKQEKIIEQLTVKVESNYE